MNLKFKKRASALIHTCVSVCLCASVYIALMYIHHFTWIQLIKTALFRQKRPWLRQHGGGGDFHSVLCWSPSHTCIKGQSPPQRQSRILGARSEAVRISSLILLTAITHPAFFIFFSPHGASLRSNAHEFSAFAEPPCNRWMAAERRTRLFLWAAAEVHRGREATSAETTRCTRLR